MTRYRWDLERLRKIRNTLIETTKMVDSKKKDELEPIINMYNQMIRLNSKNIDIFAENIDFEFDINWEDFIKEAKNFHTPANLDFINLVTNTYHIIKNAYNIESDINCAIAISNDELIDITEDFFKKSVDTNTYQDFKNVMQNDKVNHFLNIRYSKYHYPRDCETLFDNYLKNQYILLTRNNTLTDLVSLPHELFHFIFNDTSFTESIDYNMRFLNEIEGLLANLLFAKYYKENANEIFVDSYNGNEAYDDSNFFINRFLGIYKSNIENLIIKSEMLKSTNKKDKINHHKFNSNIKKHDILNPKEDYILLLMYLSSSEEVALTYSLSHLVALDLYYQILKDKEKGFYNLRRLKDNYQVNDIINYLRFRDITFMDDDYANLKKYTKNMTN